MNLMLIKLKTAITMNNITASVDAYPTFRLVNASVVILYAIRDVSSPGPPEVIAYTKSKAVSLQSVNGIHKVITFLLVVAVLAIIIGFNGGDNNTNQSTPVSANISSTNNNSDGKENTTVNVGEEIKTNDTKITFVSVKDYTSYKSYQSQKQEIK